MTSEYIKQAFNNTFNHQYKIFIYNETNNEWAEHCQYNLYPMPLHRV